LQRLRYLKRAKSNLAQIHIYISKTSGSADTGRDFVAHIQRKCSKLAALPGHMGRARPELSPDARSFAYGNYIIFFRYSGNVFEVIDILEGHFDFDARPTEWRDED
jgi:toxin ParE1/3/4